MCGVFCFFFAALERTRTHLLVWVFLACLAWVVNNSDENVQYTHDCLRAICALGNITVATAKRLAGLKASTSCNYCRTSREVINSWVCSFFSRLPPCFCVASCMRRYCIHVKSSACGTFFFFWNRMFPIRMHGTRKGFGGHLLIYKLKPTSFMLESLSVSWVPYRESGVLKIFMLCYF